MVLLFVYFNVKFPVLVIRDLLVFSLMDLLMMKPVLKMLVG